MLSVAEAFAITQQHLLTLTTESVPLAAAVGRVLQDAILADRDFPPFDRVSMDGIAIRYDAYAGGARTFRVAGMQLAGHPQQTLTDGTACLEAMTGAMLPTETDTIVRYEDITIVDGQATINIDDVQKGQNIHFRATDRRAGDELVSIGALIGAPEVAVAASVGRASVTVTTLPRVALISTGDELVGVTEKPLPHQIRRSNTYMIRTALLSLGITATLHHITDDELALEDMLADLLAGHDMLILSGGVSAGKADFVPDVLARIGVQKHFHKVEQRPGKPLWFGSTAAGQAVFALPGNPVSTILCTYRYVIPYLQASLGILPKPAQYAQLARTILFDPKLTYFLPVRLVSQSDGRTLAHPLPGSGSADFANLLDADAFMELPAEQSEFAAGDAFRVWLVR